MLLSVPTNDSDDVSSCHSDRTATNDLETSLLNTISLDDDESGIYNSGVPNNQDSVDDFNYLPDASGASFEKSHKVFDVAFTFCALFLESWHCCDNASCFFIICVICCILLSTFTSQSPQNFLHNIYNIINRAYPSREHPHWHKCSQQREFPVSTVSLYTPVNL